MWSRSRRAGAASKRVKNIASSGRFRTRTDLTEVIRRL
jgi:hypothetical protein